MNKCSCINSKTGQLKEVYANEAQALAACEESKKKYPDGDALNAYFCREGNCYHVGNSWEHFENKKPPRPRPGRDEHAAVSPPDFEPPAEWFNETVQAQVSPPKVRFSLGNVAKRPVTIQSPVPPPEVVEAQSPVSPRLSVVDGRHDKTKEAVSWVKEAGYWLLNGFKGSARYLRTYTRNWNRKRKSKVSDRGI